MTRLSTNNRFPIRTVWWFAIWSSLFVALVSGFQQGTSLSHFFYPHNRQMPRTTAESSRVPNHHSNWKPKTKRIIEFKAIELETEVQTSLSATTTTMPAVVVANQDKGINKNNGSAIDIIPTTMSDAVKTFFLSSDYGPLMVVGSILSFTVARLTTTPPITVVDINLFIGSIIFWSFQEHILHQRLLHSKFNWPGKEIHNEHHSKPYYHISIDPAGLLLGWMLAVHCILRAVLPLPLALSATIGYSLAGLFYEWAHYLVHTRVKFPKGSFWKLVKDNHVRHHLVNHNYWFSFSLPWIDDLFGTNPSPRSVGVIKEK